MTLINFTSIFSKHEISAAEDIEFMSQSGLLVRINERLPNKSITCELRSADGAYTGELLYTGEHRIRLGQSCYVIFYGHGKDVSFEYEFISDDGCVPLIGCY